MSVTEIQRERERISMIHSQELFEEGVLYVCTCILLGPDCSGSRVKVKEMMGLMNVMVYLRFV